MMTPVSPYLDMDLHPSPRLVAALLTAAAVVISLIDPHSGDRVTLLWLGVSLYGLSALLWAVAIWQPLLARWLAAITLLAVVLVGLALPALPDLAIFLPLPVLVAAILLRPSAAALIAFVETILLLWFRRSFFPLPDSPRLIISLLAIWLTLGAMIALYRPIDQQFEWLQTYFRQARTGLAQARERKADLERTLADLATANRELALLSERLDTLRLAAEEAHQAKAAFVARISHEFRTPLNMIIGLVDTLTRKPEVYEEMIPPLLLEDLAIVQRNATHLADLINDVLDMSQTETGRLQLHRAWADLGDDVRQAVTVVQPLLVKKGLALNLTLPADLPAVYCDHARIRQVILNLVSNAVRHTDRGSVGVTIQQQGEVLVVQVHDTGPGIQPEEAERIFEPFYQAVTKDGRNQGGSGLGLSISRQLIELHQGQIWLDSRLGEGSTFAFKLPISPPPLQARAVRNRVREDWVFRERTKWPQVPRLPFAERLILYDQSEVLEPLLAHYYPEVELVLVDQVEAIAATLATSPAHAILLNTAVPADLTPLLARIRQDCPQTPIIGSVFPPVPDLARQHGLIDYLIKPVRQADLEAAIRRVTQPLTRILVVDDNPEVRQLFARMLKLIDDRYEVVLAASGQQALNSLQNAPFDLILLDVVMPQLDGWQVLQQKAGSPAWQDIPVILVTAEDPVRQPPKSETMLVSIDQGISAERLVACSLTVASLLLRSEPEPDPGPPGTVPGEPVSAGNGPPHRPATSLPAVPPNRR